MAPDGRDPRRSLYRADDIAALAKRKREGRTREALASNTLFGAEPSIPTSVCGIARGRACYRGRDALALAEHATLEDAARILWAAEHPVVFGCDAAAPGEPGCVALFTTMAQLAATGHSTRGRTQRVLHAEAQDLVGRVACSFGAATGGDEPLHVRLARGWEQPYEVADVMRRAMVLLADHELTSSAFAARIAASTGASLPACLMAGLATLSGPLHGDASGQVRAIFDEVDLLGADKVLDRYLSSALPIAGFGHHLYSEGDPRAVALLSVFEPPEQIGRFIERVVALTGLQPNIDVALAALVARHHLPADAAFGLFATGRSVGLLAHAIEQLDTPQVIRPRGRYVGPAPDGTSIRSAR